MKKMVLIIACLLLACGTKNTDQATARKQGIPLVGTWQLISGTTIDKGDTTVTDYTKDQSFIKIINDTHFAFLKHDLAGGKGKTTTYDSGGGRYTLKDSLYTEKLDYCTEREWENHLFNFTVSIKNDTLTQQGVEVVEKAGINRINMEKYVRVTNPR
ncbi:hypothetical protein J2I47_21410 [Fibrella sp. HMF5335]|uniref:Lipocalin-like domain-containing protein n=1 Tax=Fibrella rubiginis TaxID=2817060 RepID=A0A939K3D2_9BACT|nr:hypothetical protein [Fibrella rubiginis]MBO0939127.1 hypothetical protein [Fibrella rubiginis]